MLNHAAISYTLCLREAKPLNRAKTRWKCVDEDGFCAAVQSTDWASLDVKSFCSSLARMQLDFQDQATCAMRRQSRMPFALRNAYSMYHKLKSQPDALAEQLDAWRNRIRQERAVFVRILARRKQLALAALGKATCKSKKLYNVEGVIEESRLSVNPDECASLVANYYNKKWSESRLDARTEI